MRSRALGLALLLIAVSLAAGCGGGEAPSAAANPLVRKVVSWLRKLG